MSQAGALALFNSKKEPISYVHTPLQMMVRRAELSANSSLVLTDKIDINRHQEINKPGKYFVQFDSKDLEIGQPLPHQRMGEFGEKLLMGSFDFLASTNKFPSNIIEIEAHP